MKKKGTCSESLKRQLSMYRSARNELDLLEKLHRPNTETDTLYLTEEFFVDGSRYYAAACWNSSWDQTYDYYQQKSFRGSFEHERRDLKEKHRETDIMFRHVNTWNVDSLTSRPRETVIFDAPWLMATRVILNKGKATVECVSFDYYVDLSVMEEKLQRLRDATSLVDFDGYFITKFRKSQIDSLPIVRKSHQAFLDLRQVPAFYLASDSSKDVLQWLTQDWSSSRYAFSYSGAEVKSDDGRTVLKTFFDTQSATWYLNPKSDKYLYKVVHVTGKAKPTTYEMTRDSSYPRGGYIRGKIPWAVDMIDDYSQGRVRCYEITQVDHIADEPLPGMQKYTIPK